MANVIFYEKPGCINNTRQKQMLAAAGHQIDARNILSESWTTERLSAFFSTLPVSEWFNQSAPRIKSGEVIPEQCTADAALTLMINDPLLIRRPLMAANGSMRVGFDQAAVSRWIGLGEEFDPNRDLEGCPRGNAHPNGSCDQGKA